MIDAVLYWFHRAGPSMPSPAGDPLDWHPHRAFPHFQNSSSCLSDQEHLSLRARRRNTCCTVMYRIVRDNRNSHAPLPFVYAEERRWPNREWVVTDESGAKARAAVGHFRRGEQGMRISNCYTDDRE